MACLPISPPGRCIGARRCAAAFALFLLGTKVARRNDRDSVSPFTADTCNRNHTGLTGLEPATSGVTDRHSNQAELQPQ